MGKFYTDFSEYTTGQQPAGWVKAGEPQVEYRIISGTQYAGGKALQAVMSTTPFAPTPLIYSDGHTSNVQEVAIRGTVTSSFGAGRIIGCVAIWNFDATNGNGYYGVLNGPQLQIWRVDVFPVEIVLATAPAGFTPEAGQMYWVRFRVDASGESPIVRLKVWPDSSPEPESWGLVHTDTSSSRLYGPGYAGVIGQSISGTQIPTIDVFGYGWDGDPAPMEPPAPSGDVMITPPSIDAAATALAPAVTTERATTVRPPLVDASASVLPPIVSTGRFASVSVPLIQASADVLAPGVAAERHVMVRAEIAEAVAQALVPTIDVVGAVTIRPPAAGAAAEIMRPAVTTVRQVTVLVPLVEAEAEALRPDVHTGAIVRVEAPTVRARAEVLAPEVSTSRQVRVLVPVLSATAEARAPIIAPHVDLPSVIVIRLTPSRSLAALISSGQTTARIRSGVFAP